MFPEPDWQHEISLMPASEFSQKQVGVVARTVDVVHHCLTAKIAGIVDDDVAKTEQTLRDAG